MVASALLSSGTLLLLASLVSLSCSFLVRRNSEWSSGVKISLFGHEEQDLERSSEQGNEPLNLTQYIASGRIDEGRKAAIVPPLLGEVKSYSGFFAVDEIYNKNLFFWYFPAEEPNADGTDPVIVWLQGGPGASSMYAALAENGPYVLREDNLSLEMRPHRWTKHNHVIYFDQPVGTGFSYSDKSGYVTNEEEVGADMHNALMQFFQLFPAISENEFFVVGESYAGKYVPAVSYTIHRKNPTAKVKINLRGLAIGDGVTDPQYMLNGDWLVQHGFEDLSDLDILLNNEKIYVEAIKQKDFKTAQSYDPMRNLPNASPGWSEYNYLEPYKDVRFDLLPYDDFFNSKPVKEKLHTGDLAFSSLNRDVNRQLANHDWFSPVSPKVEELLNNNYRVLYYTGQLDVIISYPMTKSFVHSLDWRGSPEFQSAKSREWLVKNDVAGSVISGGNLTLVLVRNAGHMVPHDQPKYADDLINKFVRDKPIGD